MCPTIVGAAALATVSLLLLVLGLCARARRAISHRPNIPSFLWAALFGLLIFGETVSPFTLAGAALIITGCVIAARGAGRYQMWRRQYESWILRFATPGDVATILRFVRELAEFERGADKVVATEPLLQEALFGERPVAEAVIAERDGTPLGMALFFHNFSTWTGWRGLYLEDLYVTPEARGSGVGGALLEHLAGIAVDRGCTPLRMGGARLERRTRSTSIARWAPKRWTNGRSTGCRAMR